MLSLSHLDWPFFDEGARSVPDRARIVDGKRCARRRQGRGALSRNSRAAHLRGRDQVQKVIIAREILKAREFGKRQAAE